MGSFDIRKIPSVTTAYVAAIRMVDAKNRTSDISCLKLLLRSCGSRENPWPLQIAIYSTIAIGIAIVRVKQESGGVVAYLLVGHCGVLHNHTT